jgi:hypothetical protein
MCLIVGNPVGGLCFVLVGVIVFRSDCKVFDCISSKSEQNWCFGVIVRYSTVFLPNPSRIGVSCWWMVV